MTNSKLGQLDSKNLPSKSNFKKLNGLDALTGKSNFDIAEFIAIELFKHFDKFNGRLALLIKNSVIKNILVDAKKHIFKIGNFQQYQFDAKKEFGVATDAAVFVAEFNQNSQPVCASFDLEQPSKLLREFGWVEENFVSNIKDYQNTKKYDGKFPLVWRSGLKHDCSKVFELRKENGHFINKLKEQWILEEDLIFPLIKSSQLKEEIVTQSDKKVIVTQRKIGQETKFIKDQFPKLFHYLESKKEIINNRKSVIYKGKPAFSIFGIGDYTFEKYKIAISGLYKKAHFSLLLPENEKPLIPDNTCYMIGFSDLKKAVIMVNILNSKNCLHFLESITFQDAKRVYTKEVLMRIDLMAIFEDLDKDELLKKCHQIIQKTDLKIKILKADLEKFSSTFSSQKEHQFSLF